MTLHFHLGEWVPTPGETLAAGKRPLSLLNTPASIKPVANRSRDLEPSVKALLLVGRASRLLQVMAYL